MPRFLLWTRQMCAFSSNGWAHWKRWRGWVRVRPPAAPPFFELEARAMFMKRYFDYDLRSYQRGYYFNLFGIIRVLKFNVATVMQKPDYIFILEIFGREYIFS